MIAVLTVLLCGAADTELVSQDFVDEIRAFGGEPWFYQSGDIVYNNVAHADWDHNSSLSVQQADMCVFVLIQEIGHITWDVELKTALRQGKPFLLLCLESTYHRYLQLSRSEVDHTTLVQSDQELVDILHQLDATLNLTAVPFARPYFRDVLRTQMSNLFSESLHLVQQRNQRDNVLASLRPGQNLSEYEQFILLQIALDETEFVRVRKLALRSLLPNRIPEDDLRELVASPSQAIARLAIEHCDEFFPLDGDVSDFLDFCVATVNDSDDVGLARRLISKILSVSLTDGIRALRNLDMTEIGARRRLAIVLESYEDEIRQSGLQDEAADLMAKCLVKASEDGWIARGRAFLERLRAPGQDT